MSEVKVSVLLVLLTLVGSLAEDCPPPEILNICECHVDTQDLPALRCPNLESWDDISALFELGLVSRFSSVDIVSSLSLTDLPPEAFANVEIDALRFFQTGLVSLARDVFTEAQANSTKELYIKHNPNFVHLDDHVPSMPALEALFVSYNNLGNLTGQPEGKHPGLPYMDISHNCIREIEPGYFSAINGLHTLILSFNELTTASLSANTFEMYAGAELYLNLAFNSISEGIPTEAFGGEMKPKGLVLSYNNIRYLNESLFSPMLNAMIDSYGVGNNTYMLLDGNELECGCEMSWIINHQGREALQEGTCGDGRLVSELTEADFAGC